MRGTKLLNSIMILVALVGLVGLPMGVGVPQARAQAVAVEALLLAKECLRLKAVDGRLIGGLANGGILVWDQTDPSTYARWTTDRGLTANRVTDLAYSGQFLWVATSGGGLSRTVLNGNEPEFRQFTTNLGGLDLTSVAGSLRGENEIVYYGIRDGGVGVINDGFPGLVYTAEEHGLIDNRVTDLAFFKDELWIATEDGIAKFASNVFTDQDAGLSARHVNVLHVAEDTLLVAGTADGVYRWSSGGEEWIRLAGLSGAITDLTGGAAELWALRDGNVVANRLWLWAGSAWSTSELPIDRARTILFQDELWVAGEYRDPEMSVRSGHAFLSRRDGNGWESHITNEQLPMAVDGVDFAPDGSLWLGSQTGDAVASHNGSAWFNIFRLATVENDSMGLFANDDGEHGNNILSLAARPNGEIWFSQFRQGVLRYMPATGQDPEDFEHITSSNSSLSHNRVVQTVIHPAGPILFTNDRSGVDVLLDPDRWSRSDQWLALPTATPGGLGGSSVKDAVVERNDVIWFAVDQVGLVRWDLNGSVRGPEEDLTWDNPFDDRWDAPITSLPGSQFDFRGVVAVAVDREGRIWAGGSGGAVQFTFEPGSIPENSVATLVRDYREKSDVFFDGLLTGDVTDLAVDGNGDMWVSCNAGLNRIRTRGSSTAIDAYTDLTKFFEFGFGVLYSPSIIVGLPGGETVWELAIDPAGRHLLVGSGNGAALLTIAPLQDTTGEALTSLYFYPNPFVLGDTMLKLGGIMAAVTFENGLPQGGAQVEIYNLEGQLVFRDENVAADSGFWDGRNRFGNVVAGGLYAVKVGLAGETSVKTLAVVR